MRTALIGLGFLIPLLALAAAMQQKPGRERADMIVAQDGTSNFKTIQAALDSIPKNNSTHKIILVKNGIYAEKLYINASHLSIVGENRERTRIEYAELRKNWRETHPDDWGAAVVNIGDKVTDLILANLTVHNNYGSLHGDHDHQFALRAGGNATRISLLDGNFIADGGDTVSLWNTATGMYYHANCYFEGWVDYVCPRGWCYITDSRFFGHNLTASVWHDGSLDPDAKLVIRNSHFDGVPGFPLGRNNRDGQFFLIDARFSLAMADKPIYQPSPPETYRWPARAFYADCRREGGDYAWFKDNLDAAPGHPRPQDVTAAWTFAGRWDPENNLPSVLPGAAIPQPANQAKRVDPAHVVLRWIPGRNAISHRLFFGPGESLAFREEMPRVQYEPGPLAPATSYSWRVDELTPSGIVIGSIWRFTTAGEAGQASEPPVSWAQAMDQPAGWYATPEAARIADNLLLYQRRSGGWPKNIDMAIPLSADGRLRLAAEKELTDSTIDNNATTTQIRFFARVFAASGHERFRNGASAGLRYLLAAQYRNGGWPQYFPLRTDYSRHITFNDDAMVRVMDLLDEAAKAQPPFTFLDPATRARAAKAVEQGVQLILKTQIITNGRLTVWCAQHDESTLKPCGARSYELPSLSGRESVGIVRFLMALERPTPEIVRAVEAAVAWFQTSALRGWRLSRKVDPATPHGFDYVLESDATAPPIWARFYDIATHRPMYVGRDGIVKQRLADVEYERRTGYTYLGPFATELLDKEVAPWRKRIRSIR